MKKMKKRKGFTLTELAIVIAVIAILIAVLVPTFTSLINKARESSDSQLAKNMNTILSTSELDGNTPERMEDVNYLLEEGGYKLENLNPSADGNIFVWNSTTNRISYIDADGTVLYAGDTTLTADTTFAGGNNYWLTAKNESQMTTWKTYKLSYYIATSSFESSTISFNYAAGVDTGTYTVGEITYDSTITDNVKVEASKAKVGGSNAKAATADEVNTDTAIIRGTVKKLTVNNDSISVTNYASIKETTTITKAVEYTESGYSVSLVVSSASDAKVTIVNNGYVKALSGDGASSVTNYGYVANADSTGITNTSTSYNISTYTELASFRDKVNNGATFADVTVTLTANIDISGRAWVPIGYDSRDNRDNSNFIYFAGTFNGNGKTISGLTNTGFTPTELRKDTYGYGSGSQSAYLYGLFGILNGAIVKDVKLTNVNIVIEETELDSVGGIAGFALDGTTISGCTVSGSIAGTDAVAGIVGRIYVYSTNETPATVSITNCTNNATITATATATGGDNKAAGIIGNYLSKVDNCTSKLEVTGCINNGSITAATMAAGILTTQSKNSITIGGCTNNGSISVTDTTFYQIGDGTTKRGAASIGSIYCITNAYTTSSTTSSTNTVDVEGYLSADNDCYNYGTLGTAIRVWDFTTNGNNSTYSVTDSKAST